MNKYWHSQFRHWTIIQAKTPEQQRRGHMLSLFLLIFIAINFVLVLLSAWDWLVNDNEEVKRLALPALVEIGVFMGMRQLNRRGWTTLSAHAFLGLIFVAATALPESTFIRLGYAVYSILIIIAGFITPPKWSFFYAALASLGYGLRFYSPNALIPYPDLEIAILLTLATVTYVIASRYDDTLKKLAEKETGYRELIDNARDVIFTLTTDNIITSLNPSFETFTGWSRAEWLGRSFVSLIAEDDRPATRHLFQRAWLGEILEASRLRLVTATGDMLVFEFNMSLQTKDNRVVGLLGIARDMTVAQHVEEALKTSEQRFRTLIERGWDAFTLADAQGTILYASPSTQRVLGYAPEEFVGVNAFSLFHPDDLALANTKLREVLQVPGAVIMAQARTRHKDGSWRWLEGVVTNLFADPDVHALVTNYHDVTERIQAELALRESEERYRLFIQYTTEAIYLLDMDTGQVLDANPAFLKLLGYTYEAVGSLTLYDIVTYPHENIDAYLVHLKHQRSVALGERKWRRQDGSFVDVYVTISQVPQKGHSQAFVLAHDITARKRAEEKVHQRESILEAVAYSAELLFKASDWRTEITAVLEQLGQTINASHAYLFENHKGPDDEIVTSIQFEWVAPLYTSDLDNPIFKNVPLRDVGFESWFDAVSRRQPYIGDTRIFTPVELAFFSSRGIKALLEMPLYINDHWWGIVGFDDCTRPREWSNVEVDALVIAANVLSAAIQRKQTDEALRESEHDLQNFFNNSPDTIYVLDLINHSTRFLNRDEFLGYSKHELESKNSIMVALHPEDRPMLVEQWKYLRVMGDAQVTPLQYRVQNKNGNWEWIQQRSTILSRTSSGVPQKLLITLSIITERKKAEEKVQQQNQRLKALREIDVAILAADSVETIVNVALNHIRELTECQRAVLTLIDWETNETVLLDVSTDRQTALPAGTRVPLWLFPNILQTLRQNEPALINDLLTLTDPPALFQSLIKEGLRSLCILPLFSQDSLIGTFNLSSENIGFFDIEKVDLGREVANQVAVAITQSQLLDQLRHLNTTLEQRVQERTHELAEANERLQELDQMKDQFVANVSHELRTPLANFSLYLGLLHKRGAESLDRYLPILKRENQRLAYLIEDLLTLARLEREPGVFTPEPVVLDVLLAEVLEAYAIRAEAKSLTLTHELAPQISAILVDRAQMIQVFTNLISNAVGYTLRQGVVTVTTTPMQVAAQSGVAVRVHNTGPVIPDQDLPHLFERFYRGQTGRESGEPGTGLGLSICQEIVERHGGRITVISATDGGTEFQVWLPVST